MAPCSIDIVLDAPDGRVHPDDALTGEVRVDVTSDCRCRSLEVSRHLQLEGPDEPDEMFAQTAEVFAGRWTGGETYSYPFSLSLPNGPYTYRGEVLNLEWAVVARARLTSDDVVEDRVDIELSAGDRPVAQPYQLGPPEAVRSRDLEPDVKLEDVALSQKLPSRTRGWVLLIIAGLGLLGAILEFWSMGEWLTDRDIPCFLLLLLVGFGGYGVAIIYNTYRDRLRNQTLQDVEVDCQQSAAIGESMVGRIVIESPSVPGHIQHGSVTLQCREELNTGDEPRSHRLVHDRSVLADSRDRQIERGQPVRFDFSVDIPTDAPPSFVGMTGRIQWELVVELDVDGWRDWTETVPLTVEPPGQRPAKDDR